MAFGLFLASILEALRWTSYLAKLSRPLARAARLGSAASAAFVMAFVSPTTANGLLSNAYEKKEISLRELSLSNLFNSLPTWLSHTPSIFFIMWPAIGFTAVIYVGITILAAIFRMFFTLALCRLLLPKAPAQILSLPPAKLTERLPQRLAAAIRKAWAGFKRKMPRLAMFTAPVYLLMCLGQEYGLFQSVQTWMAAHLNWLAFLKPQAVGIIALQLAAEMGATLGAAGAALMDGSLTQRDIVLALLAGNVLSTPLRAIRHQLPAYAGYYRPGVALKLILANQALRAASIIIMLAIYAAWSQA